MNIGVNEIGLRDFFISVQDNLWFIDHESTSVFVLANERLTYK